MLHGGGLGVDAPAGPGVALPLDLAEGGPPARAEAGGGPLRAVADQEVDHVGGQPQVVVQPQQGGEVRRGKAFAQLPLHLGGEAAELPALLQLPGHLLLAVGGGLVGGLWGRALGGDEPQVPEDGLRRLNAAPVPAELPREGPGRGVPPAAEQGQVEEGGVPVPPVQEALHRLGGEGDGVVGGVDKDAGHGSASFLS